MCEHTSSTKNGPPDQHIFVAFNPHTAFNLRESFSLLHSLRTPVCNLRSCPCNADVCKMNQLIKEEIKLP